MFVVGIIFVIGYYGFIYEELSSFKYNYNYNFDYIYKVFMGYILGYFIVYYMNRKYSKLKWDKGENNKNVHNISILITVIVIFLLNIVVYLCIGLLPIVYSDDIDEIIVSDTKNSNIENDDKNYQFSVSKKFVKEGFDSVFKVLSESLPEIIGGLGGAKIGGSIIKGTPHLPPGKRAALGIVTAGAGAICIGLGGVLVRNFRKNKEYVGDDDLIVKIPRASFEKIVKGETGKDEFVQTTARKLVEFESTNNGGSAGGTSSSTSTSSGSGSGGGISSSTSSGTGSGNLSNATDKVDLGGGDGSNFIPSLLDGDLSPLEVILNCEILINIMILVHIIILVLVLIEKFNVKIIKNSSVGFISKYLNKYKLNKVENFINKLGELTNKYLSLLIILNVIIIIFYICLNVYVNIELSNNLNEYISVYNKFHIKEGGILFLLLNCKIKCKYVNRLEKRLFSSSNTFITGRNRNK
jgi:hypothetical protein